MSRRCVILAFAIAAACGGRGARAPDVPLSPAGPRLPPPLAAEPGARGASYLTEVAAQVQPAWGQFLEDCRLRLPVHHPLNAPALAATAELAVGRDGRITDIRIAQGSGNGDFDTAVFDVLADASPLSPPPTELESDDQQVHVRWLFARDRRQAGPATAQVVTVELSLLGVVDRLLDEGALARAARRIASAPATDPDREAATERAMIAALREGLASPNGVVRVAAVEAVGRALVHALARQAALLVLPSTDADVRLAAIATVAALRDPAAVAPLLIDYSGELAKRPQIALAKTIALVALGHAEDAAAAVRAELDASNGANAGALAALGVAPDPAVATKLPGWLARGDARTRAGVCTSLPAAAPQRAPALIARGLHDADASVRAACGDAASRSGVASPGVVRRLRELAHDRDRAVRARAVAALGIIDPAHRARVIDDPAPEVRLAAISGAGAAELRTLAGDRDPDVRAAAVASLADRVPDLSSRAATDPAPQVRRAAVAALSDEDTLARLANDDAPEVATAAEIRLAARRGRAATAGPLLSRLAAAPAGGAERVRIALAWLLAR